MISNTPLIHRDYEYDPEGFSHLDIRPEVVGLRARIFELNQQSLSQSPARGTRYAVVGCPPGANTLLDHFNNGTVIVEMMRVLLRQRLDEIVVADEPLALNMLRQRTFPGASIYRTEPSGLLEFARAEAKIIGHRQRIFLQAIQEQLILSGQVRIEDYTPILLMSDDLETHRIRFIFSRLFSLTVADPLAAQFQIFDRDASPFLIRDFEYVKKTWELMPSSIRVLLLGPRGGLPYDQLDEEERSSACQAMAYKIFQDAFVTLKGGVKVGFEGEIKLDEHTQHVLRYAGPLGLDEISQALSFSYPVLESGSPLKKMSTPYRAFCFGQASHFDILALGGYSKVRDLEGHVAAVIEKYFPLLENFLVNLQGDGGLLDLPDEQFRPTEAVDYLRYMLARANDGRGCQMAIEAAALPVYFDPQLLYAPLVSQDQLAEIEGIHEHLREKCPWGVFEVSDPVQDLKDLVKYEDAALNQPVRTDMLRRELMKVLKELAAALASDPLLKSLLEASGLTDVTHENRPISDLAALNNTSFQIDVLTEAQQRRARIIWLRDRIQRLKTRINTYDRREEAWGEIGFRHQELFDLILDDSIQDDSQNDESLHAYFIRQMAKVLSGELCKKPQLASLMTDFFRRMAKVLHPDRNLTIDCSRSYWKNEVNG